MAAPASIEYFKKNFLKNGLAKPSRYEISITSSFGEEITIAAENVTLPSRGFVTIEEQWYGPVRNIPIGNKYDSNVIMTFPVSSDQKERFYFEKWMDNIVKPSSNKYNYLNTKSGSSMTVTTLDELNNTTSVYTFEEPYPANIYPTSLGAGMRDDYTRMQVQFEYRKYSISKNGQTTNGDTANEGGILAGAWWNQ
jgi:hypothetical protein